MSPRRLRRPPQACPTCGGAMELAALSCSSCGTGVTGQFAACEFCSLSDDQRQLLRVFLDSRGNVRELERFLGVSYPTARSRLDDVLGVLGVGPPRSPSRAIRLQILEEVASGAIGIADAADKLSSS